MVADAVHKLDPGGTLPIDEAFKVVLRQRALRETGTVMSAEQAEAWYWTDRAEREASAAG